MIASNRIYEADLDDFEEDEDSSMKDGDDNQKAERQKTKLGNAEVNKWKKQFAT